MKHTLSRLFTALAVTAAMTGLGVPNAIADDRPATFATVNTVPSGDVEHHTQVLTALDRVEIGLVAHAYVTALSDGSADRAYRLMAPEVRDRYEDAKQFLAHARRIHKPLAFAKSLTLDGISTEGPRPVQTVYLRDRAGLQWLVAYGFDRDTDNKWRIVSCLITLAPGQLA